MNKYTYPIVIVVCFLILGGSILIAQNNKQNSIERQAQLKIDAEQLEKEEIASQEYIKDFEYAMCEERAGDAYWSYMELNGEKDEETEVITAATKYWNEAKEMQQTALDNCFRQIYK